MKLNRDIFRKLPLGLRIQIEENAQRKPLTQSELAIEQRRILAELRKHKTPGERTDLKPGTSGKTFPEVRATDLVGKLFNESRKQVEKRLAIVDAAEAEPEKFGPLKEQMDRTGRVNGAYRRLKNAQQAEALRAEPPPLPGNGPYRVVVADPPWAYEPDDEEEPLRGVLPYPTMSLEQVCALDVRSIMHPDSILFLWVTNFLLARGLHTAVLRAWDLEPKTVLTWPKERPGRGHWLIGQTEHVVLAVRGRPVITLDNTTTLLRGPFHLLRKNAHSEKPLEFYDFVERLCPASRYADLWSRYWHNHKWDCHGDEAPRNDAAAPDQQRLVEDLKASADTERHLDEGER
jgi:N6-adenosine-specific RNA methylase IME4